MTIKDNLNNRQLEAVNHGDGPLLIAAGAGSGKTKTLTSRLAMLIHRGVPPENIIAITFTNKAAQEMKERVQRFEPPTSNIKQAFIGTFHSLGARILKKEAKLENRTSSYTIFDEDDSLSLIRKIIKREEISKEKYRPPAIREKISQIKNELLDAEEYLDKVALAIFKKYEAALEKNNAFDFDDLIEKTARLFKKYPSVLKKYQNQFRYILVDEYQDVNAAQYQFIKLLAATHKNLNVVGDDSQSIYKFRGSNFRNFLNFENDWPSAKVVLLEQNYRSTANIIAAASEMIQNNKFQKLKTLWTENPAGELIKVIRAADAEEEANFVSRQIFENSKREARNSRPQHQRKAWCGAQQILARRVMTRRVKNSKSKIQTSFGFRLPAGQTEISDFPTAAVLYRTNAQSRAIEQSLIAANIPYRIFGGLKFYERKEIKDLVAGLRLAHNPKDLISRERLEKNFDKKTAAGLISELPRLGKELNILELINFFLSNADYFDYLEKNFKNSGERLENINEFIRFASEFQNLNDFLERVSLLQSGDSPTKSQFLNSPIPNSQFPINLMSIHLAKGLEFDKVFVIGCSEGLLPHQRSYGSLEELEEERRLMYVAMTRAKKELCLSFYNLPSRFLYEIPPELTEFSDIAGRRGDLPNEEEIYIDTD
jgi:DNA helicase-2/ATP-dependent DNA helicase PcrA